MPGRQLVSYERKRGGKFSLPFSQLGIFHLGDACEQIRHSSAVDRIHNDRRSYFSCREENRKVILFVLQSTMYPSSQGSDKRVYHILEILTGLNHDVFVSFYSKSKPKQSRDDLQLLNLLDVRFIQGSFRTNLRTVNSNYEEILSHIRPDIIIMWLWFWDMKSILPDVLLSVTREKSPSSKVIVFTDDVHSKREQQIAEQYKGGQHYQHFKRRSLKMKKIELSVYKMADIVVGISVADCKEIVAMEPAIQSKVNFVSFVQSPWDVSSYKFDISNIKPWSRRKNLAFVGNGENPTNVHAINWFLQEVAPEISKGIKGVHTFIIGPGWEKFRQNKNPELLEKYLIFKGSLPTDEMLELLDSCKVFVSPIIASTGINTKNVLALSRGIPLVTTPAGSIGMCGKCDTVIVSNPLDPFGLTEQVSEKEMPLLVGRDVYDFTQKVKDFYYEEDKWIKYSEHGIKHVHEWFGKEKATRQVDDIVRKLYSL